jgi:putative ABC transport system ATP-binding protein
MSDLTVVEINEMSFRWKAGEELCLDIAHFSVNSGEKIFIYGPSGSGKSTLLALIGGVLSPTAGTVRVLSSELGLLSESKRDRFRVDHIGFIFQQFNLIPYLSVIDNVLLPCRFSVRRRIRSTAVNLEDKMEAQRLLECLGIGRELWYRRATMLSVGQQQRVAAARALIGRPEIIIADEPTSSLDVARQNAFLDLLLKECEVAQSTVLFVSHDLRLSTHFSRKVALADLNRVMVQGDIE